MQSITVSELTGRIKSVLEADFQFVQVTGEISNFKHHSSGHFYFALKDENAQINALMWSSLNKALSFKPADGMKVIVKGRVTVYAKRGSYQIDILDMRVAGVGDIFLAFEQLKEKLRKEGLFDKSHKKPLPQFPERVVIITSETGAALQDFYRIASRRYPVISLMLINSKMQGAEAAMELISALETANDRKYSADVIVLARGGGSAEDLWVFNDESLARAIFRSNIPVVSAIGHEVDFTIADFVADVRAPTPSAAAEMILPDISELRRDVDEIDDSLTADINSKLSRLRKAIDSIEMSYHFRKPAERMKDLQLLLKTIDEGMRSALTSRISLLKIRLDNIENSYHFKKPADTLVNAAKRLDEIKIKLLQRVSAGLKDCSKSLDSSASLLSSYNPENVLKRGFAIVSKNGNVVQRNAMLEKGDSVGIRFYDGSSNAIINEKLKDIENKESKRPD
ncbi:MAG: exodeoxyribonuclease VII large subunit [Ignavibacteria bacterium]|nr:exodeoxyribonuclease VII large subunit [Ignavibacteria bacterium]